MTSPKQPDAPLTLNGKQRMAWMAGHWRVYGGHIPLLLALSVLNAGVMIVYPVLVKRIIDGIDESIKAGPELSGEKMNYLGQSMALLLLFGLGHFAIYGPMQWLRARLNLRFQFGIRLRAFECLTRLGPSFFGRFRTGDLVVRLNDDVNEKLAWYMCSGIFRVIEALLIIIFGAAAMLYMNPRLTLYTAGPLPLLIALFVVTSTRLQRHYAEVQRSISTLSDSLESCFSGIRVVKSFAAEAWQQKRIEAAIEENRRAELRAVRVQTVIDSLYGNIWQLALVGLFLVGGAMVIRGEMSLGDLVAMEFYTTMLVWPMFDVGQFLVRGRLSAVSIDRLAEVENMVPEVHVPADPLPTAQRVDAPLPEDYPPPHGAAARVARVELRDLSYRHPGAPSDVLRHVSLAARPGQLTAVAGPTGAGKSTLLNFLPRLIDPATGAVLLGGLDLREWPLLELRQSLGYVPQEPLLLSGTVLENIRFGRSWISDADIEMALDVCQLRSDLGRWPLGLLTVVGPRGLRLSGGQKQRVALARAVAGRPRLMLLDDCTASLDAETEAVVWRSLNTALPGCTTLLVTHRPSTLKRAEQIVVLDEGAVCQQGSFAEVDVPGTVFHRLYTQWEREERERTA